MPKNTQENTFLDLRRNMREAEGRCEECVRERDAAQHDLQQVMVKLKEAETRAKMMDDEMEELRDKLQVHMHMHMHMHVCIHARYMWVCAY